jgi:hypothetical protein
MRYIIKFLIFIAFTKNTHKNLTSLALTGPILSYRLSFFVQHTPRTLQICIHFINTHILKNFTHMLLQILIDTGTDIHTGP